MFMKLVLIALSILIFNHHIDSLLLLQLHLFSRPTVISRKDLARHTCNPRCGLHGLPSCPSPDLAGGLNEVPWLDSVHNLTGSTDERAVGFLRTAYTSVWEPIAPLWNLADQNGQGRAPSLAAPRTAVCPF